jgi:hypothetical protein
MWFVRDVDITLGSMKIAPRGILGRVLAVLWLMSCVAVLIFGFTAREVHDMPIAFVLFLVLLSFPLGAAAVVVLGVTLGASGITYIPFWSEVPLWCAAVLIGYWQWFVLVPSLARIFLSRRDHAV